MSKPKFTAAQKVEIIEAYINGHVGHSRLQDIYGVHPDTIYGWITRYENYGITAFSQGVGNKCYTKDVKLQCVRAYLNGEGSLNEIVARYNLSSNSILRNWVRCYNANMELEDYEPKREVTRCLMITWFAIALRHLPGSKLEVFSPAHMNRKICCCTWFVGSISALHQRGCVLSLCACLRRRL